MTEKKVKYGVELELLLTEIARRLSIYQHCYFLNCCEIQVCPKIGAYLTFESGWLKINVKTNMGPQNNNT